ncbi:reverse transcriptase domain-containing protein [Lysinibacillus fusiformis]|uniref:reverse transcriptase domain-containing protein n=1 Tax=Lysinibacillus fusiformis TaxID=28031 RepID=UPI001EF502CC|nr:reverse transcriptase domain-containing protein [Lysinibacillus fusiformis]MCG7436833.1 hypothetical protein [Lysinibacillus fusiformis]
MSNTISKFLLADGFFAKELPSEFNSKTLSEIYNLLDLSKSALSNEIFSKWTKLVNFSIPKKGHFRRIASVPHPLHFIRLASTIESGWEALKTHYDKSTVSISKLEFTDNKIENKYSFNDKQKIRIENLATNRYILSVDINRYYPSIYTHTIPWCLHTKVVAKQKPFNPSLLGNQLDTHIRNMQDGQTMGIPIGPITSSIIQEIIGTSIDADFQRLMGKNVPGFRYTDDIEYFFNNFEDANKALSLITKILKEYNLDTNIEKTKILQIPLEIESEWVYFFRNFKFKINNTRERAIEIQQSQLREYFNAIFKFQLSVNEKGISKYALKALHWKIIIHKENWALSQSLLLQSALIDPSAIPIVFGIIESYKYKGYDIDTNKLTDFINSLIEEQSLLNNDYEIIWALSLANKFNLSLNESSTSKLSDYENALVNIMVMILHNKGLLHQSINFDKYKTFISQNDLYNENWIFLYECCRNNWLDKTPDILTSDRLFKQLHLNNVTFITPDYSVARAEVSNTICQKCIGKYDPNTNNNFEEILSNFTSEYQISLDSEHESEILEILEVYATRLINEQQPDSGDAEPFDGDHQQPNSGDAEPSDDDHQQPDSGDAESSDDDHQQPDSGDAEPFDGDHQQPNSGDAKPSDDDHQQPDSGDAESSDDDHQQPDSGDAESSDDDHQQPDSGDAESSDDDHQQPDFNYDTPQHSKSDIIFYSNDKTKVTIEVKHKNPLNSSKNITNWDKFLFSNKSNYNGDFINMDFLLEDES